MPKQLTKVGKYTIVGKMAKGGMGSVYKARHPTLKRFVILKQLTLRGGAGISERFKREAQLMIDFRHENIVPVYDHFKSGSSYFIAMEFVDGRSLDRLIAERNKLSTEASILIFSEVCKGLKYAHDKGVIHRDIKPANILLSKEGEVKLVDFGIATTMESEKEGLTQAGMTLGTPAYMSPEQIADSRSVDKRSDVYSMGVMLYEMLTGEKPFPGSFTPDAIDRINRGSYKNPKRLNPDIPGYLVKLIKKMMHHRVKRRYTDLYQVLRLLSRYTRRYRSQKAVRSTIKRYLEGTEVTAAATMGRGARAGRPLVKFSIGLALFLVFVVGGLYSYYRGYFYEYFGGKNYGRIELKALVPQDYHKRIGLIYAAVRLNASPDEQAPDSVPLTFSYRLTPRKTLPKLFSNEEEEKPTDLILTSGGRYLRAGYYEVEIYLENRKYYRSLYLKPRVLQKQAVETSMGRVLEIRLHEGETKPIDLSIDVMDSETGKSLYAQTDIALYIEDSDRWVDWKRYRGSDRLWKNLSSQLTSGANYQVNVEAPSHYREEIEFFVEPDLDTVHVSLSLVKKAGTLLVNSSVDGLEILIDNRKGSFIGGKTRVFEQYGRTIEGEREFKLSEGSYVLTVRKGTKRVKNFQFTISPGRTTQLQVSFDPENKEIDIQ